MKTSVSADSSMKPMNLSTLKLIRHRCEGDVRSRVLRWIGLPIGGTSAAAFFVTLFFWIPQQLTETNLAKFSQDLLQAYVQESLTDAPEYKEQLDAIFRNLVMKSAKQEVTPHIEGLSKEKFEQVLSSQVNKAVTNEVERINQYPEMLTQVNASVKATLRSDDFKLLRNVIGPHLQIIQQRLQEEIAQNAERSIKAVKSPLPEDKIFDKRGYSELEDIIKDIKSRPLFPDESFALRFFIAAESGKKHNYDEGLIFAYLDALKKGLGDNFRFALILDRRMQFVALAEVEEFKTALQKRSSAQNLVDVLNDKNLSFNDAKDHIGRLLGAHSISYMDEMTQIKEALKSEVMRKTSRPASSPARQIAVVRNAGGINTFQGVTSRRRLLESLLP